MNLENFEKKIPKYLLERGNDYFEMGNIEDVELLGDGAYSATVLGSDVYAVYMRFSGEELVDHSCECPFDKGNFCKHAIAVLYYLKNGKEVEYLETILPEISEELALLEKKELIELFIEISKKQKPLREELIRYFELDKESGDQFSLF